MVPLAPIQVSRVDPAEAFAATPFARVTRRAVGRGFDSHQQFHRVTHSIPHLHLKETVECAFIQGGKLVGTVYKTAKRSFKQLWL